MRRYNHRRAQLTAAARPVWRAAARAAVGLGRSEATTGEALCSPWMRRKAAIFLLCLPLFCAGIATAQTVVSQGNVRASDGRLATGIITITPEPEFIATDGTVVAQTATARVTNGSFSVSLEPNVDGGVYVAEWQLYNTRPRRQIWSVPVSGSPVGLGAVVVHDSPTSNYYSTWSLADGNYCLTVTGGVVTSAPAACVAGAISWSGLTSTQWSGFTIAQWAGLTN
jgi:hypothetical protein